MSDSIVLIVSIKFEELIRFVFGFETVDETLHSSLVLEIINCILV